MLRQPTLLLPLSPPHGHPYGLLDTTWLKYPGCWTSSRKEIRSLDMKLFMRTGKSLKEIVKKQDKVQFWFLDFFWIKFYNKEIKKWKKISTLILNHIITKITFWFPQNNILIMIIFITDSLSWSWSTEVKCYKTFISINSQSILVFHSYGAEKLQSSACIPSICHWSRMISCLSESFILLETNACCL